VEDASNELQAVLIDFGQAVDTRHPESSSLLFRDLTRIRTFFVKQGVKTLNIDAATQFVVDQHDFGDCDREEDFSEEFYEKPGTNYKDPGINDAESGDVDLTGELHE
jgi:RIO-like serine/threonine protein kinase